MKENCKQLLAEAEKRGLGGYNGVQKVASEQWRSLANKSKWIRLASTC